MKNNLIKNMGLVMLFFLGTISVAFSWDEQLNRPDTDLSNNIPSSTVVKPPSEGDYGKLKYSVQTNKKSYAIGEPIFLQITLTNESDQSLQINEKTLSIFLMETKKVNFFDGDMVPLTSLGERQKKDGDKFAGILWYAPRRVFRTIQPGEKITIPYEIPVNAFFDMTLPQIYEITSFCPTVMGQETQKFDPPLQSTVIIRVMTNGLLTIFPSDVIGGENK